MQGTDASGKRIPFRIGFLTANREKWLSKKNKLKQLELLKPGTQEHVNLMAEINAMDVGGKFIEHDNCILSGHRGIHATNIKSATARFHNHSDNRTRNIIFLPGNNTRKIHNSLIMRFNEHHVLY